MRTRRLDLWQVYQDRVTNNPEQPPPQKKKEEKKAISTKNLHAANRRDVPCSPLVGLNVQLVLLLARGRLRHLAALAANSNWREKGAEPAWESGSDWLISDHACILEPTKKHEHANELAKRRWHRNSTETTPCEATTSS